MKKILLSLSFFILIPHIQAISPTGLEKLRNVFEGNKNYIAFIDVFNDIADTENYKTPDGKRDIKRIVQELMVAQPYAAAIILDYGDYWKFAYLIDNGWDIMLRDDGVDLLMTAIETHHKPLVVAVLKAGGYKLITVEKKLGVTKSVRKYFKRHGFKLPEIEEIVRKWVANPKDPTLDKLDQSDDFRLESPGLRTGSDESPMPETDGEPLVMMSPGPEASDTLPYEVFKVPFGTNREIDPKRAKVMDVVGPNKSPETFFTYNRGNELVYGIANVTIPKDQERGDMKLPNVMSWDKKNPAKFMTLDQIHRMSKEKFFESVSALHSSYVDSNPKVKKYAGVNEIFLYVHGFNVDYEYAMMKTAQLMRDMRYPGISLAYTWPARAVSVPFGSDYRADAERLRDSKPYLQQFILDVIEKFPTQQINIVAHSLGTRGITHALVAVADKIKESEKLLKVEGKLPEKLRRIREIILAAPAVDAQDFMDNLVKPVSELCERISVIASDDDIALKLQTVAGDSDHPLGLRKNGHAALSHLVTNFDVSGVSAGTVSTEHSVYSQSPPALNLMADIIKDGLSIDKLEEKGYIVAEPPQENYFDKATPKEKVPYWKLRY